jgi:hypothetical protein
MITRLDRLKAKRKNEKMMERFWIGLSIVLFLLYCSVDSLIVI